MKPKFILKCENDKTSYLVYPGQDILELELDEMVVIIKNIKHPESLTNWLRRHSNCKISVSKVETLYNSYVEGLHFN